MPYVLALSAAQQQFPEFQFVRALTPSEQKAAFHVRDTSGHNLCLKVIAPGYSSDRLDREILALQSLQHPNIAQLRAYERSIAGGAFRHYVLEEYVEGSDLSVSLASGSPWALDRVKFFFGKLFSALQELSTKRIVHRDLKPSNIRVNTAGEPVVIDFGLARLLDLPALTQTSDGAAIGTPLYFSPEQFNGTKHDIDHRTDLFAAGVLLHQAVLGNHPFFTPGMDRSSLELAVCRSETFRHTAGFQQLSPRLKLLLGLLLAKSRTDRPVEARIADRLLQKG